MNETNKHRDLEKTIVDLTIATENNPKDYWAYHELATAFHKMGKYPEAMDNYKKIFVLKMHYIDVYLNRGSFDGQTSGHEKAVNDYNKTIRINSDHVAVYLNLAMGSFQHDVPDDLIKRFQNIYKS